MMENVAGEVPPARQRPTGEVRAVLLDFFGTLVAYSPSRTEQGYHASHTLLGATGARIGYADFLREWAAESERFDERSAVDDREFSMRDVTAAFLTRLLRREPTADEVTDLMRSYVAEWNTGVTYRPDLLRAAEHLAGRFRLAVVTNTHHPDLVPGHLAAMGVAGLVETVVTSVEVGWRKPHQAIYAEALRRLGLPAGAAVFVGDSYLADYVGPRAVGIRAFLIDPDGRHDLPDDHRLRALSDLPGRLAGIRG